MIASPATVPAKPTRAEKVAAECAAIAASGVCVPPQDVRVGDHVRLIRCDDDDFPIGRYYRIVVDPTGEFKSIIVSNSKRDGAVVRHSWSSNRPRMIHYKPDDLFQIISRKEE